ncbi:MAG: hypothetical protein AMXMBFR49_28970 [Chlorobiota bacterium]
MPTIYDNIDFKLFEDLEKSIQESNRVDICTGYFNLRGWDIISDEVEELKGEVINEDGQKGKRFCRLLIGMQRLPEDELRQKFFGDASVMDNAKANELRKLAAQRFKKQLQIGLPENKGEASLKKLLKQLKEGRVVVKLQVKDPLHAKLYITHKDHHIHKHTCFMGSSNLTYSGLMGQGELNIDVLEQDAAKKLNQWFEDRWGDRWCIDITKDLIDVIENSWAADKIHPPYHIYLKMAYHLSMEAQTGIREYTVPEPFASLLFDFQKKAVQTASIKLNTRGGVLIGDVVGLGKTFVAAAIAKIFQDEMRHETLIICPKNLERMWDKTRLDYELNAKVIPVSMVHKYLPEERFYRTVIIDESHNLRNSTGQTYMAIKDYLDKHNSKVILLSATPYNKEFGDIANQLKLFIGEDEDLGISPEIHIGRKGGVSSFKTIYPDILPTSIAAFEKSEEVDDWSELMRLYMVRRTRGFIMKHYALTDPANGRKYLLYPDGRKSYFPARIPRKIEFPVEGHDDQYAALYTGEVLDKIESLELPRYGLTLYRSKKEPERNSRDEKILANLTRAGSRMIGICRTNFFKRLDSSGHSFILTLRRHLVRNYLFIYAIENKLSLPIGAAYYLDPEDFLPDDDIEDGETPNEYSTAKLTHDELMKSAAEIYSQFSTRWANKFDWISPDYFTPKLKKELLSDCEVLLFILGKTSNWDPAKDKQLRALYNLITTTHPDEKLLIFTEYADTAQYVYRYLHSMSVEKLGVVWGNSDDPTSVVHRFSPVSNGKMPGKHDELRVLVTTDVLSEGQNLQDAHIVINYDLPWAIIGLIQRAGRVDRIGQESPEILVYSFLPDKKVESVIKVIEKLKRRIRQSTQVLGGDETFFEDQELNLETVYGDKPDLLEAGAEDDGEIDLTSYAYQIWKNATDADPSLKKIIPALPDLVYSSKENNQSQRDQGVVVYTKTSNNVDVLVWLNGEGETVTTSHFRILRAASCNAETPAVEKITQHHHIVAEAVKAAERNARDAGKSLLTKRSVAYKVLNRLEKYYSKTASGMFPDDELKSALALVHKYHMKESARDVFLRQLKNAIGDEDLRELFMRYYKEDKLFIKPDVENQEGGVPTLICSLGLVNRN